MLYLMRKYAKNWLIKFILGAIVIVFVFWGVGSFRSKRANRVAQVNGQPITVEQYNEAYNNLIEQYRQQFGNNLNDELVKVLQIKRQALDRLIDQRLLLAEAKKLNFQVSDQELTEAIRSIKAFQSTGIFDNRQYQNVLNRIRMTPEAFEAIQRESMLIGKLRSFITGNAKVSDQEALEWFQWNKASVNIEYCLFEPEKYETAKPSQEEISSFYEKHKENYRTEPQLKVRYVYFDPEQFKSAIEITDEEIKDQYEAKREEFETPETVEARHILIKADENASPEIDQEARQKALEVLKLARGGKDFGELAKEYSEGPSKDKGGYLGAFTRETMVKPFADAAFAMQPGQISEPVRTQFGWHIIKVEKINEPSVKTLEEAAPEIRRQLEDEAAKVLAYDEAEALYDAAFAEEDLAKAAQARSLAVLTSDFFTQKGPDKTIPNSVEFAAVAFNLNLMEISEIQNFGNGYYILQPIEKIPEKIPELKDVAESVRRDLTRERQVEEARKDANKFLTAIKSGETLDSASKTLSRVPSSTGFFERSGSIPDIGFERAISEAAFKLSEENKVPDAVIKGSKGFYVIAFKERKMPGDDDFEQEKAATRDNLLQQKRLRTFDAWLSEIRKKSVITYEEGFIDS